MALPEPTALTLLVAVVFPLLKYSLASPFATLAGFGGFGVVSWPLSEFSVCLRERLVGCISYSYPVSASVERDLPRLAASSME